MKGFRRWTLLAGALLIAAACSRRHETAHRGEPRAAEPAPPTPDTTPIAILRTPAGLVLGLEGTPHPALTPSPGGTPAAASGTPPPTP